MTAEDGVALIAALLGVVILTGLAVVFVATAIFQTQSTGHARDFESAIHVAEAAVDDLLPCMLVDTLPPPPDRCEDLVDERGVTLDADGDPYVYDLDDDATLGLQRAWVMAIANQADELVELPGGEGFAVRPENEDGEPIDVVFAVGWIPNRTDASRTRVIKIQFDIHGSLDAGLLVGGDLRFGASAPTISGSNGSVHTNGKATHIGNSQPNIEGDYTTSETFEGLSGPYGDPCPKSHVDGKCLEGQPASTIPIIRARDLYDMQDEASVDWYDLCPDGTVRPHSGDGEPCSTATVLWPPEAGQSNSFRGWRFQNDAWRSHAGSGTNPAGGGVHPGVYYVYQKNAHISHTAGSSSQPIAIIAEDVEGGAGANSGHIEVNAGANFQSPGLRGVVLAADRDIKLNGGNIRGLITAHEQLEFHGNPTIVGAAVAQDARNTDGSWVSRPSRVNGNINIHYDHSFDNFGNRVRITHWNELRN